MDNRNYFITVYDACEELDFSLIPFINYYLFRGFHLYFYGSEGYPHSHNVVSNQLIKDGIARNVFTVELPDEGPFNNPLTGQMEYVAKSGDFQALLVKRSEVEIIKNLLVASPDYQTIKFQGESLHLKPNQAGLLKTIHEYFRKGIYWVGHRELMTSIGLGESSFNNQFTKDYDPEVRKKLFKEKSIKKTTFYALNTEFPE